MKKKDYVIVQILNGISLLLLASKYKYFLFVSRIMMVVFMISSFVYVAINFNAVQKKEVNFILGSIFLGLSIICLFFALLTISIFFIGGGSSL